MNSKWMIWLVLMISCTISYYIGAIKTEWKTNDEIRDPYRIKKSNGNHLYVENIHTGCIYAISEIGANAPLRFSLGHDCRKLNPFTY